MAFDISVISQHFHGNCGEHKARLDIWQLYQGMSKRRSGRNNGSQISSWNKLSSLWFFKFLKWKYHLFSWYIDHWLIQKGQWATLYDWCVLTLSFVLRNITFWALVHHHKSFYCSKPISNFNAHRYKPSGQSVEGLILATNGWLKSSEFSFILILHWWELAISSYSSLP